MERASLLADVMEWWTIHFHYITLHYITLHGLTLGCWYCWIINFLPFGGECKNKLKQKKPKNKPKKKKNNPRGFYLKLALHLKGAISPSLAWLCCQGWCPLNSTTLSDNYSLACLFLGFPLDGKGDGQQPNCRGMNFLRSGMLGRGLVCPNSEGLRAFLGIVLPLGVLGTPIWTLSLSQWVKTCLCFSISIIFCFQLLLFS